MKEMNNLAFICDSVYCVKNIDAEEKLLLKKLSEAFSNRNLEKFKMLLQRPIRKSLALIPSQSSIYDPKSYDSLRAKRFNFFRNSTSTNTSTSTCTSISTTASIDELSMEEKNNKNKTRTINLNNQISQRILCYRKNNEELSLIERIMKEPDSHEFISFIWTECDFWRDPVALYAVNDKGLCFMDFVIESGDDMNLFTFLIHDLSDEMRSDKNYFLKIKNEIYAKKSGISIFSKIYSKMQADEALVDICLIILNEILKEMKEICDIRREVRIDAVLSMPQGPTQNSLLRNLIKYWKVNSKDYHYYRNAFCEISPFFKLFLSLKEHDEDDFEDAFPEYLDYLRQNSINNEHFTLTIREDTNILLTLALDTGMRKAMHILISCQSIDPQRPQTTLDFSISNEISMLKLLESGYYLGYEDESAKDGHWFNAKVFEQFLDSCVTMAPANGVNRDELNVGIQLDYTFLISPDIRPIVMKNYQSENGSLIFSAGMRPLEWILESDRLRHLITHPLLSTFINLKSHKFSQIYNLNLYMFCIFYVFPFMLLFVHYDLSDDTDMLRILSPAAVATFYLTIRESIQFFWIIDSKLEYFKKKSNKLEMLMIFSSWWLLMALVTHNFHSYQVSSAFIILFGAIELLSILPYSSLSIYMFMLKEVTITFLKFFTIFILIILAFTFSFYAILKPIKHSSNQSYNDTATMQANEAVFKNFENPFTSFIKTILMFAGDFSVEPFKLDSIWKQILFLCFVLTAFILYNLINGLAISDIQKLKDDAEFLNLKQRIRTTADCEKILCNLYWKICGTKNTNQHRSPRDIEKNNLDDNDQHLNFIKRTAKKILTFIVNRYPFLHKMDSLWIDLKYKAIFYKLNKNQEPILRKKNGAVKSYSLDDENYEQLIAIIKKKDKNYEDIGEKIESIEKDVKRLMMQMDEMLRTMRDERDVGNL
ncbi:hypothetical protein ACKWTF_014534 [Chironomus riparius]